MDPTFASSGKSSPAIMKYIGNGRIIGKNLFIESDFKDRKILCRKFYFFYVQIHFEYWNMIENEAWICVHCIFGRKKNRWSAKLLQTEFVIIQTEISNAGKIERRIYARNIS